MMESARDANVDTVVAPYTLPMHPPLAAILPLCQLEDYLATLQDEDDNNENVSQYQQQQLRRCHLNHHHYNQREQRETKILQMADFLYGSMFSSALTLLDEAPNMITKITAAPSKRSLYLVKSSTNSYNRFRGPGSSRNNHNNNNGAPSLSSTPSSYLCLVPCTKQPPNNESSSHSPPPLSNSIYYCSCRSFFENTKHSYKAMTRMMSAANSGTALVSPGPPVSSNMDEEICNSGVTSSGTSLCKHLLAVVLLPHLHVPTAELTVVSDDDFAALILERTLS